MAVVSRIAKVRIFNSVTPADFREWLATAVVQDTAAGASVDITVTQTSGGTAPPGVANTLTLTLYNDAGSSIRAFTLTPGSASQTVTFHFTGDGTSTGAARAGTVEIAIRATRTDVATYDVESDGTPDAPGTGNSSTLDRGWIRGTTTSTTTLSNVALGGAKLAPAEYDESLFVRTTLGANLYVARALTTAVSGATPALSASTNSTTTGPWDATFTTVVDERFPAAVTTVATSLTVPNATLTGLADTVLTATNDSMTVDPRPDAESHLWQTDDDQFGTPPMSKHNVAKSALVSSYSGMAFRLVRARTRTGIDGLSTTVTLDPRSAGANIVRTSTTATRGGQAGWTELAQLGPFVIGGQWDATLTITAPADIDAPGYVVSHADVVTILAQDPRILLRGYVNKTTTEKRHFTEGDPVVINLTVVELTTHTRIDPARVTDVKMAVLRYRASDDRMEYLNADLSGWTLWEPTAAAATLDLAPSSNDPRNYIRHVTNTTGWNRDLMALLFSCKVDGTPYSGFTSREEVGAANDHIGYAIDPIGLALSGVLSAR